jgi:shikimate dehydrogenase
MRALGLGGLSVTTPHKDDVARLVDERGPDVEALGAANCVVPLGDGRLRGENTDGDGFVANLREQGIEPGGLRCCVLGAGGAARSVVLALSRAGAAEVVVVNRTPAKAEAAAALGGDLARVGVPADVADADLIVNGTSIGMGDDRSVPFDEGLLRPGQTVAELVVHPVRTALLAAAEARGLATVTGVGMLVHQAAIAFEHWTGVAAPVQVMRAAAQER